MAGFFGHLHPLTTIRYGAVVHSYILQFSTTHTESSRPISWPVHGNVFQRQKHLFIWCQELSPCLSHRKSRLTVNSNLCFYSATHFYLTPTTSLSSCREGSGHSHSMQYRTSECVNYQQSSKYLYAPTIRKCKINPVMNANSFFSHYTNVKIVLSILLTIIVAYR